MNTRARGTAAEALAAVYLMMKGLRFVARNYRCRAGEIDLIMRSRRPELLVIVEVRYRRHSRFGGAVASVTAAKQKRIIRAASLFLRQDPGLAVIPLRFDVLGIEGALWRPQIRWIRNAFESES